MFCRPTTTHTWTELAQYWHRYFAVILLVHRSLVLKIEEHEPFHHNHSHLNTSTTKKDNLINVGNEYLRLATVFFISFICISYLIKQASVTNLPQTSTDALFLWSRLCSTKNSDPVLIILSKTFDKKYFKILDSKKYIYYCKRFLLVSSR